MIVISSYSNLSCLRAMKGARCQHVLPPHDYLPLPARAFCQTGAFRSFPKHRPHFRSETGSALLPQLPLPVREVSSHRLPGSFFSLPVAFLSLPFFSRNRVFFSRPGAWLRRAWLTVFFLTGCFLQGIFCRAVFPAGSFFFSPLLCSAGRFAAAAKGGLSPLKESARMSA